MLKRLPSKLSPSDVEALVDQFAEGGTLDLDIESVVRLRPFSDARLLGALLSAKRQGIPVRIVSGALGHTRTRDIFFASPLGVILAELGVDVVDHNAVSHRDQIRHSQAEVLDHGRGVIGSGREVAAVSIDRFAHPPSAELFSADEARFSTSLAALLFGRLNLERISMEHHDYIRRFVFEAVQNTIDHAVADLSGQPIDGIRLLIVRRLNTRDGQLDEVLDGLTTRETPVFRAYIESLRRELHGSDNAPSALVEMTIVDSGVGIAARMAGTTGIFAGAINEEERYLQQAFTPTGTSKASSISGAGLGLYKVMRVANALNGLLLVRTGRLCMFKHFLGGVPLWPSLDLLRFDDSAQPLIGGTAVSLLVPWMRIRRDDAPEQLSFRVESSPRR